MHNPSFNRYHPFIQPSPLYHQKAPPTMNESHRWLQAPLRGNPHGIIQERSFRSQPLFNAVRELLVKYNDILPKTGSVNVIHELGKNAVIASVSYTPISPGEWTFVLNTTSDDEPL